MQPPDAAPAYALHPVTGVDLPAIGRWLAAPHVREWWGEPAEQLALIEGDMMEPAMRLHVVCFRGQTFAYAQSWDPHAFGALHDQPLDTCGVDAFIGPPEFLGQGHGSRFLRLFAENLLAEGASRVVIDPDADNLRAIRAYRKAGFRPIERRRLDGGPVVLMRFDPQSERIA